MMKRRAIIAAMLFVVGTAVYLMVSGAPRRVHVVTIGTEFCLLAIVTFFLCASSVRPLHRVIGAAVSVAIIAVGSTWLSSRVIAALNPLEPMYFAMAVIGFSIQALIFVGVVWTLDFAVKHLQTRAAPSIQR